MIFLVIVMLGTWTTKNGIRVVWVKSGHKTLQNCMLTKRLNRSKSLAIIHSDLDTDEVMQLKKHLIPLTSNNKLQIWSSRDILAGSNRIETIKNVLADVDMVGFWVSPDLWTNNIEFDFIHQNIDIIPKKALIVPIIARHSAWDMLPFFKQYEYNIIPVDKKPILSGNKDQLDERMDIVAQSISRKLGLATLIQSNYSQVFWKKISFEGRLSILLSILTMIVGAYFAYPSFLADQRENKNASKKEVSVLPVSYSYCGFPQQFRKDSLYVLITRFEDFENDYGTECYGRGIERRIDQLVQKLNLPVSFCYRDELSPNQSREADILRDKFHADMIIWGKLRNAGPNCRADGFCLQFSPSDTLVYYADGEIQKPKLDSFQQDIASFDIEQGLINIGEERFDEWFIGMFNLKVGKINPDIFVIDKKWDDDKKIEAYCARGNILTRLGRYAEAIQDFNNAIKINPQNGIAYTYRAEAQSNPNSIISDCTKSITINPNNLASFLKRGEAKFQLNLYDEALKDFNHAIILNPNSSESYNARGAVLFKLKKFRKSILDLDRAIQLNPKNSETYRNRGVVNSNLGYYEKAIADFDTAISLNPKLSEAYNNRGAALAQVRRYAESIVSYDQAIIKKTQNKTVYTNRAFSNIKLERYLDVIDDCNQAIKLDSNYWLAYGFRGLAKDALKRYEDAIKDYDKVILIDPKNAIAYNNRAYAKRKSGYYWSAANDYFYSIWLDPKRGVGWYLFILALIYFFKFKRINTFIISIISFILNSIRVKYQKASEIK